MPREAADCVGCNLLIVMDKLEGKLVIGGENRCFGRYMQQYRHIVRV